MAEPSCAGVTGNNDHRCLCNEGNLGPKDLSQGSSPAALLQGYRRTGDLEPAEFLAKWCTMTFQTQEDGTSKRDTQWHWPHAAQRGFLLATFPPETPIQCPITLGPGTLIDRFGHDDTVYFAPFGTPFAMRSLPPSSLNDEYAVYRVVRGLSVDAGPIAPGFEQPGLGTQYISNVKKEDLFNAELPEKETWLVKLGREEVERLYRKGSDG